MHSAEVGPHPVGHLVDVCASQAHFSVVCAVDAVRGREDPRGLNEGSATARAEETKESGRDEVSLVGNLPGFRSFASYDRWVGVRREVFRGHRGGDLGKGETVDMIESLLFTGSLLTRRGQDSWAAARPMNRTTENSFFGIIIVDQ